MKDFQLKKKKREVSLFLQGSSSIPGFIFLSDFSSTHSGPERVSEVLANQELYFPFQKKNGEFLIIRKAVVYKIVVDAEYELEIIRAYGEGSIEMSDVVVTLTNGKKEKGQLLIEPRESSMRASDELNRDKDFLKLLVKKNVHLIGTKHVSFVQEKAKKQKK